MDPVDPNTTHRGQARLWLCAGVCAVLRLAAFPFDGTVSGFIGRLTFVHSMNIPIRSVGELGHGLTVVLVFLILLVLYDKQRTAWGGFLAAGTAGLAAELIKSLVGRPRPGGSPSSFPSGHTSTAFAAAVLLAGRFHGSGRYSTLERRAWAWRAWC